MISFVQLMLSRLLVINFLHILICCSYDNSLRENTIQFSFDDVVIVVFSTKGDNS